MWIHYVIIYGESIDAITTATGGKSGKKKKKNNNNLAENCDQIQYVVGIIREEVIDHALRQNSFITRYSPEWKNGR